MNWIDKTLRHVYMVMILAMLWMFVNSAHRFEVAVVQELYVIALAETAAADEQAGSEINPDATQSI